MSVAYFAWFSMLMGKLFGVCVFHLARATSPPGQSILALGKFVYATLCGVLHAVWGDFWEDTIVKRASWQWEDEELISYIFEGGFLTGVCTYVRMCGCTALTLQEL